METIKIRSKVFSGLEHTIVVNLYCAEKVTEREFRELDGNDLHCYEKVIKYKHINFNKYGNPGNSNGQVELKNEQAQGN